MKPNHQKAVFVIFSLFAALVTPAILWSLKHIVNIAVIGESPFNYIFLKLENFECQACHWNDDRADMNLHGSTPGFIYKSIMHARLTDPYSALAYMGRWQSSEQIGKVDYFYSRGFFPTVFFSMSDEPSRKSLAKSMFDWVFRHAPDLQEQFWTEFCGKFAASSDGKLRTFDLKKDRDEISDWLISHYPKHKQKIEAVLEASHVFEAEAIRQSRLELVENIPTKDAEIFNGAVIGGDDSKRIFISLTVLDKNGDRSLVNAANFHETNCKECHDTGEEAEDELPTLVEINRVVDSTGKYIGGQSGKKNKKMIQQLSQLENDVDQTTYDGLSVYYLNLAEEMGIETDQELIEQIEQFKNNFGRYLRSSHKAYLEVIALYPGIDLGAKKRISLPEVKSFAARQNGVGDFERIPNQNRAAIGKLTIEMLQRINDLAHQ